MRRTAKTIPVITKYNDLVIKFLKNPLIPFFKTLFDRFTEDRRRGRVYQRDFVG